MVPPRSLTTTEALAGQVQRIEAAQAATGPGNHGHLAVEIDQWSSNAVLLCSFAGAAAKVNDSRCGCKTATAWTSCRSRIE